MIPGRRRLAFTLMVPAAAGTAPCEHMFDGTVDQAERCRRISTQHASRCTALRLLPTAWIKHRTAPEADVRMPTQRKYDWAAIQAYYDAGHTYRKCRARFGFERHPGTRPSSAARSGPGHGPASPRAPRTARTVGTSSGACSRLVYSKIVAAGAGSPSGGGSPSSIQIDHINGIRDDHRIENLRMLCPNCHSQTETYGARNQTTIVRCNPE